MIRQGPSPAEVQPWLVAAKPGTFLAYHEGHLASDRAQCADLDGVALAFYEAQEHGFVLLVQWRVRPGVCLYVAIRTGELAG